MKKKLFAMALCVIMVVAMTVPAFAAGTISNERTGGLLNCYGNYTSNFNNRNVTDYATSSIGNDQLWNLQYTSYATFNGYVASVVSDAYGNTYGLNINTNTNNCNLRVISGNEHDALCYYGQNYIKLANYSYRLSSSGTNGEVSWSNGGYNTWYYSH